MDEKEKTRLEQLESRSKLPKQVVSQLAPDELVDSYWWGSGGDDWIACTDRRVIFWRKKKTLVRKEQLLDIPNNSVFRVDEEWSGDLGMHVEQSGSGYYSGMGEVAIGTFGTETVPIKHYMVCKTTVHYKTPDGQPATL